MYRFKIDVFFSFLILMKHYLLSKYLAFIKCNNLVIHLKQSALVGILKKKRRTYGDNIDTIHEDYFAQKDTVRFGIPA